MVEIMLVINLMMAIPLLLMVVPVTAREWNASGATAPVLLLASLAMFTASLVIRYLIVVTMGDERFVLIVTRSMITASLVLGMLGILRARRSGMG